MDTTSPAEICSLFENIPPRRLAQLRAFALQSSLSRFWGAFLRECPDQVTAVAPERIATQVTRQLGSPTRTVRLTSTKNPKRSLLLGISRETALGRFEFTGLGFDDGNSVRPLESMPDFLAAFRALGRFRPREEDLLLGDLASSCDNLLLGLCLRERWRNEFSEEYRQFLAGDIPDVDYAAVRFEAWCALGHPLHPTPKSRSDMSSQEVATLSPEAGQAIEIRLIAVPREEDAFGQADGLDYDEFMRKAYLELCGGAFLKALQAKGLAWRNVHLIPVHPWQRDHLGADEAKGLRDVNFCLHGRPLLSFRTVASRECTRQIKLPLQACITSAVRQLSPRSVRHAVAMSHLIENLSREGKLSQHFAFQRDEAFIFHDRKLGAIYRDRLAGLVPPGCLALPAAVLLEESPRDRHKIILQDMLERFKAAKSLAGNEAVLAFLRRYAQVACEDVLRLLSVYGIGCEAHMQNSVMAFRDGVPERLILRDAEDLPICLERFCRHFPPESIPTGTWNVPEDPELARKVMNHSLLHAHLGILILEIDKISQIGPERLWAEVAEVVAGILSELEAEGCAEAAADREFLLGPTTSVKCLLRMKLLGQIGNEFVYREFPNPLGASQQAS